MTDQTNIKTSDPIFYHMVKNAAAHHRLAHGYLIAGPAGRSLGNEALFLLQTIMTSQLPSGAAPVDPTKHVDLQTLDGAQGEIKKDMMLDALHKLHTTPLDQLGIKGLLIKNVENANQYALNALLKFLEDPPLDTYVVLTTNKISNVLPTIKSRVQILTIGQPAIAKQVARLQNLYKLDQYSAQVAAQFLDYEHQHDAVQLKSLIALTKRVKAILDQAIVDHNTFFNQLNELFEQQQQRQVNKMLSLYYSDIWKYSAQLPTFFSSPTAFDNYLARKFDYVAAIKLTNHFLQKDVARANLPLNKADYISQLRGLYE